MADKKQSNFPAKAAEGDFKTVSDFPADNVPVTEKNTAQWALTGCKAIHARYINNFCGIRFSDVDEILTNRVYGDGDQSSEQYRERLEDLSDKNSNPNAREESRKAWMNVNWEVISELPKLKRIVLGIAEEYKYRPVCSAIDEKSGVEKEEAKFQLWLDGQLAKKKGEILEAIGATGVNVEPQISGSIEEVEAYKNLGGIKLPIEIGIEKILRSSLYESKWNNDIVPKIIGDLFDNRVCAARDYTDEVTGRAMQRYVDISRLVIEYNRTHEYNKSTFAGEYVDYSIKQVASETNLTPQQVESISGMYDNWLTNGKWNDAGYSESIPFVNRWILNNGAKQVTVLECEWITIDYSYYNKFKDRDGSDRFVMKKTADDANNTVKKQVVYKAKWLVGTDIVWDFGPAYDVPFDKQNKKPMLSFHVVRQQGPSFVKQLRPYADMYCLTWYKLQNALAMAPPAGLAVEFQALQNMTLAGKKLDPLDIIKLRTQTGFYPYKATNMFGKFNTPHGLPFKEIEGGIGRQLDEFFKLFQLFNNIKQGLTGFNDLSEGATPSPETGFRVSAMAMTSTSTSLRPLFSAFLTLLENVAIATAKRGQIIAKFHPKGYETYYPIMGETSAEVIKIGAGKELVELGIHIEVRDNKSRDELKAAALEAFRPGQNGQAKLSLPDYLFIQRMIDNDELKLAEVWLGYKEQKATKEQAELAKAAEQSQGEGNMALADKKHQNDIELEKIKQEGKLMEEFAKYIWGKDGEQFKGEVQLSVAAGMNILQRLAAKQQMTDGAAQPPVAPEQNIQAQMQENVA